VQQGQLPAREHALEHHCGSAQTDDQEAVEDEQVVQAGEGVVEHPLLADGVHQEVLDPLADAVEAVFGLSQQ